MLGPSLETARDRHLISRRRRLKRRLRPVALDVFERAGQYGEVDIQGEIRRAIAFMPMRDDDALGPIANLTQALAATPITQQETLAVDRWEDPHNEIDNEDELNLVRASDTHGLANAIVTSAPFQAACHPGHTPNVHYHARIQRNGDRMVPACEPDIAISWGARPNEVNTLPRAIAATYERKAAYGAHDVMTDVLDEIHLHGGRIRVWREDPGQRQGRGEGEARVHGFVLRWIVVGLPRNVHLNVRAVDWIVWRFVEATGVAVDAELERTGVMRGARHNILRKRPFVDPQGVALPGDFGRAEYSRSFGRRNDGVNLPGDGLPNHIAVIHGHALEAIQQAAGAGRPLGP